MKRNILNYLRIAITGSFLFSVYSKSATASIQNFTFSPAVLKYFDMKPTEKLLKERDRLRLQIKKLKDEYAVLEPGSPEELRVGTALASLRMNLCKL